MSKGASDSPVPDSETRAAGPGLRSGRRARLLVRWRHLPANLRGALWMLASALLFVAMSTLVKFLGQNLNSFQVAFFRAATGLIFILPFMIRAPGNLFRPKRLHLHLARGIAGACAMMCGFYGFTYLPLADATAITFARALFLVPLAMLVLREVVGPRRLGATLVGFVGVLIILRPTGSTDPAALVALTGAALVAVAVIFVKVLSRDNDPLTLLFTSGIISTVVTLGPALWFWTMPTWEQWVLLMLMGAFGVAAHTCFVRAYAVGEATALAPLDYTRLIFATMVGFFVFADLPDLYTVLGAVIIVASTLYITVREAQTSRADAKASARAPQTDNPA